MPNYNLHKLTKDQKKVLKIRHYNMQENNWFFFLAEENTYDIIDAIKMKKGLAKC